MSCNSGLNKSVMELGERWMMENSQVAVDRDEWIGV